MMKREAYINNPYKIEGIDERVYTTKEDEQLTIDPETGQYYSMRRLGKDSKVLHDSLQYSKLFHSSLGKLVKLSPAAIKLMLYSMCHIRPFSETIVLNPPDCSIACGMSVGTVYDGVKNLLDNDIIRKKLGSNIEFWFDPNVFFNGNRVKVLNKRNI
jgi:hypothetical protein